VIAHATHYLIESMGLEMASVPKLAARARAGEGESGNRLGVLGTGWDWREGEARRARMVQRWRGPGTAWFPTLPSCFCPSCPTFQARRRVCRSTCCAALCRRLCGQVSLLLLLLLLLLQLLTLLLWICACHA